MKPTSWVLASLLTTSWMVASPVLAQPAESEALACARAGDHACVIRLLDGHTESARELELLIASLRASGAPEADVVRNMRLYLSLYPTGRQAAPYRQFLTAHGHAL